MVAWIVVNPLSRPGQSDTLLEISGDMYTLYWAYLRGQTVKNPPAVQETQAGSLGWKDPLKKEMATYSSILDWRIPWTEEPGGLQSRGSQVWT